MPLLTVKKQKAAHQRLRKAIFDSPLRAIFMSFVIVILAGALILMLPISTVDERSTFFNGLFTSVSAISGTGLMLVDTGSFFSGFGQAIVLVLIQIGGLGVATFTTFFYVVLTKNRSWRMYNLERETTTVDFVHPASMLKFIMGFTLAIEAVGAALLAWRFWPTYGARSIWHGVFHSISAFCTAGLDILGTTATRSSSLSPYNSDPVFMLVTIFLMVAGGLGFIVWYELVNRRKYSQLSFHTKIVLKISLILVLAVAVFTLLVEGGNTAAGALGQLPAGERPVAALFQAATVTSSTGYYTIDQTFLTESSRFVGSILMIIGAGPGSTAGGIKITTVAVVLAVAMSELRSEPSARLGRHRIRKEVANRAITLFSLALFLNIFATLAISIIEQYRVLHADMTLLNYWYAVTSAFGNNGLTAVNMLHLHKASQAILVLVMFIGRVGIATFLISLMRRDYKGEIVLPDANIIV